MKQILFALMLFAAIPALSQDKDTLIVKSWARDTLTATRDTVDLQFKAADEKHLNSWSIVAYTTTGTDTIQVYTLSADATTYSQCALTDLSAGSAVTSIIITTTPKEFLILDPVPTKIRMLVPDVSASIITIVAGKYKIY